MCFLDGNPKLAAKIKVCRYLQGTICTAEWLPIVGRLRGKTQEGRATVPLWVLSISINAAGCLTCTRNTARLNTVTYNFPSSSLLALLNQKFITMQSASEKEKEKTTKSIELRSLTA